MRTVLDDIGGDDLDDLMITSRRSYRLLRVLAPDSPRPMLVHLCLERGRSNLAVARRELAAMRFDDAVLNPPIPVQGSSPAAEAISARADDRRPPVAGEQAPDRPPTLPRRAAGARAPAPAPTPAKGPGGLSPVLSQQWATDQDTLSRLLGALRALS